MMAQSLFIVRLIRMTGRGLLIAGCLFLVLLSFVVPQVLEELENSKSPYLKKVQSNNLSRPTRMIIP